MVQSSDRSKQQLSTKEISMALSQYNLVVKVFRQLIGKIEKQNLGDMKWFVFSGKNRK